MTTFLFIIVGIAFVAGIIARSLVIAPPPRVIYVHAEPVERESGGCLPIILMGAVILLLLALGSG